MTAPAAPQIVTSIEAENLEGNQGQPGTGTAQCKGLWIQWAFGLPDQRPHQPPNEPEKPANGVFLGQVVEAARQRLEYIQTTDIACEGYNRALKALENCLIRLAECAEAAGIMRHVKPVMTRATVGDVVNPDDDLVAMMDPDAPYDALVGSEAMALMNKKADAAQATDVSEMTSILTGLEAEETKAMVAKADQDIMDLVRKSEEAGDLTIEDLGLPENPVVPKSNGDPVEPEPFYDRCGGGADDHNVPESFEDGVKRGALAPEDSYPPEVNS